MKNIVLTLSASFVLLVLIFVLPFFYPFAISPRTADILTTFYFVVFIAFFLIAIWTTLVEILNELRVLKGKICGNPYDDHERLAKTDSFEEIEGSNKL